MSIKILIDMNLTPDWVQSLRNEGWTAVHWSTLGEPNATDRTIMEWAESNGYVVFTHDLDFGAILALTHKTGPSVVQVRGRDVLPDQLRDLVVSTIRQHETDLRTGALIVVDERKKRVRILPIDS